MHFHNMFILNYFSNLSFSYFVMIYYLRADFFLMYFCDISTKKEKTTTTTTSKQTVILFICSFLCVTAWSINVYWPQGAVFNILTTSRLSGNIHCSYWHYQQGKTTFEDWVSFRYYVIWVMDDVKCAIFVALIMTVAAEIVIEKSGICVS